MTRNAMQEEGVQREKPSRAPWWRRLLISLGLLAAAGLVFRYGCIEGTICVGEALAVQEFRSNPTARSIGAMLRLHRAAQRSEARRRPAVSLDEIEEQVLKHHANRGDLMLELAAARRDRVLALVRDSRPDAEEKAKCRESLERAVSWAEAKGNLHSLEVASGICVAIGDMDGAAKCIEKAIEVAKRNRAPGYTKAAMEAELKRLRKTLERLRLQAYEQERREAKGVEPR